MTSSSTLRQAASAVFAVTTVVPLLIFVWTLHSLDTLSRPQAQVGLCLALAIALLGFYIFRGLVAQMSNSLAALGNALEKPATFRAQAPPTAPAIPKTRSGATAAAPATTATPATSTSPAAQPAPATPNGRADATHAVPGIGAIEEVQNLNRAMAVLWQSEAEAFKGQRVVISIVNSPRPISGTLVLLSHDGLLIQTDRMDHVPVGYSRIAAIDAEQSPA